jgi:hypothetical protein
MVYDQLVQQRMLMQQQQMMMMKMQQQAAKGQKNGTNPPSANITQGTPNVNLSPLTKKKKRRTYVPSGTGTPATAEADKVSTTPKVVGGKPGVPSTRATTTAPKATTKP